MLFKPLRSPFSCYVFCVNAFIDGKNTLVGHPVIIKRRVCYRHFITVIGEESGQQEIRLLLLFKQCAIRALINRLWSILISAIQGESAYKRMIGVRDSVWVPVKAGRH